MPTMRLKKQDGTWDKVPVLGSYQAVLAANEAATNAQNAANTAEKIATDLGLVDEAVQTAVASAEQATSSATTASAKADIATTKASEASTSASTATAKADAASMSATNAAQSYANADAVAAQLTEYLATKENLTAPAVDKTLLIEGAAADAKVVGEKVSELKGDLVKLSIPLTINKIKPDLENKTINGITCTKIENGYVFNGTSTAQTIFYFQLGVAIDNNSKLSGLNATGSDNTFFLMAQSSDGTVTNKDFGDGVELTENTYNIAFMVRNGVTISNVVVSPFIPTIYTESIIEKVLNNAEYVDSNKNRLLESTEMDFMIRHNLFNKNDFVNGTLSNLVGASIDKIISGTSTKVSNIIRTNNSYDTLYITQNGVFVGFYGIDKKLISFIITHQNEISVPNNTYFVRAYFANDQSSKIMLSTKPNNEYRDYNDFDIQVNQINSGKKWVAVGDSLTEKNNTANQNYTDLVSRDLNLNCINMGVSGTGYWKKHNIGQAFFDRIENVPTDAEIVTIFGSGNDMKDDNGNVPTDNQIGNSSDTTLDTWCGYVNQTLDKLIAKVPYAKIGIISPTPWSGTQPNFNNTMKKMADKLEQICKMRSIAFLNLYYCSNLRPWDASQNNAFAEHDTASNTHPNDLGNLLYYGRIREFIRGL